MAAVAHGAGRGVARGVGAHRGPTSRGESVAASAERVCGVGAARAADRPPQLGADHVALVSALAQLPEAQRVAIVLHHLADLPVAQVAEETGASVSAVKQQLVRGRAALAGFLADSAPTASVVPAQVDRREGA